MRMFFQITKLQLLKTVVSMRFIMAVLLVLSYISIELSGLKDLTMDYGLAINYSFVSFVFSNGNFLLYFFIGILLMFSNLPYRDEQQVQLVLRVGKRRWFMSKLLAIVMTVLLYIGIIVLYAFLFMNKNLDFSTEWGQVLGTLGQRMEFSERYMLTYSYNYYVQLNLTPLGAFVRSVGILLLVAVMFGFIMLIFNLIKESLGTVLAGLMILVHLMTTYVWMYYFYYLSPISWIDLNVVSHEDASLLPGYGYILTVIFIVYGLAIGLGYYLTSKKSRFNLFLE